MAEEREVACVTPSRDLELDKENIVPEANMKTGSKLDAFSPFVKHGSKGFKILSDDEINQTKKSGGSLKGKGKRRSLATLQPSTDGKGKLVGNGRETLSIKEAFKRKKDTKDSTLETKIDVKVHTPLLLNHIEKIEAPSVKEELTDDQLVSEALSLMKKTDKVEDSYWKTMAKERREALEETLKENENLYDEIDKLSDENKVLKQKLSDAECYKILYNNLLASQKSETDSTPEGL